VWGKLFSYGSDRGRPGFFYFVAGALYLVQLGLARASKVLAPVLAADATADLDLESENKAAQAEARQHLARSTTAKAQQAQ